MRIGIIGPGALGSLVSARLFSVADHRDTTLLIDHNPERAALLQQSGITCEFSDGKQTFPVLVSCRPQDFDPLDVLFCCVKSHAVKDSLDFAAPLLTPSTLLVFMQNGISHLRYAPPGVVQAMPVFATSSEGATLLRPGQLRHGGSGQTHLGFLSLHCKSQLTRLQQLAERLQKSGIAASVSKDIRSRIWEKLLINTGINALTAIHNLPNGQLLHSSEIRRNMQALVEEAGEVAEGAGVTMREEDPLAATVAVCEATSTNISSMLQDVRNQRPTEIDAINGAVSRLGKQLNIITPANDAIVDQIQTIEAGYK